MYGIVVSRRPYGAEGEHFAGDWPIAHAGKLRGRCRLAGHGQPSAQGHQRQEIVTANILHLNLRVTV